MKKVAIILADGFEEIEAIKATAICAINGDADIPEEIEAP